MLRKLQQCVMNCIFAQTNRGAPVRALHPVARVVLDRKPEIAVSRSPRCRHRLNEYNHDTHENLLGANMGLVVSERNIGRRS